MYVTGDLVSSLGVVARETVTKGNGILFLIAQSMFVGRVTLLGGGQICQPYMLGKFLHCWTSSSGSPGLTNHEIGTPRSPPPLVCHWH
jgi:hypothetical protein